MAKSKNITGLPGDIMGQVEFLKLVALEALLLEPMSDTYRKEIGCGVTWFLNYCIDEQLENVDTAAVEKCLQDLQNKQVFKIGHSHFFSVLRYFFHWTEEQEVFPNICKDVVLE